MASFRAPTPLLPDLIAAHARWRAEQPALVDGDTVLSWGEFAARTARLANALAALGVRPRERVAVLMDSRHETAVALFGIVRAGAVAVPLNVSITDAAVAAMCADAGCVAVLACGAHVARIEALRVGGELGARHFIACEAPSAPWRDFESLLAAADEAEPAVAIEPDDECNLIYSSGTTALPKGIVHTHACRMHWAFDCALALRYRSGCRTLCSLGLFSNISWVAMLATLLVGGTIVLLRRYTPATALALIERERITHGAFEPVQLERLLAAPERSRHASGSLETLMCCGSPLDPAVKRGFVAAFGCELIELYGLTEGIFTILEPEDLERKARSVGKPVLGSEIRLLGDDDREVARGAIGEIVGRSRIVMSGYHARPDADREAAWVGPDGRTWLRTGDLGRLDDEGFLYIVDRKKDMILSGGQNVFPADIEAVMRTHPGVADVAVVGVPSAKWGETPVAVVVARDGAPLDAAALLDWTNARVGKQQRLERVVGRAELPRNPNGKVLKRELRRELLERSGA